MTARKANPKFFVGTIKVIVAAQNRQQAIQLIESRLTGAVEDWGFARDNQGSRQFFQPKKVEEELFELRDLVLQDEESPDPDPELGEDMARDERRRRYEMLFDRA